MSSIYLDHNSTAPILPEVASVMAECHAAGYANPASQHHAGRRARYVIEHARTRIGELLGADVVTRQADRVIFTSGGTEANNLAILGLAAAVPRGVSREVSSNSARRNQISPLPSAGEGPGVRGFESGADAAPSPQFDKLTAKQPSPVRLSSPKSIKGEGERIDAPHEAIISSIEHPSLRGAIEHLERQGWLVHRVGVTRDGVVKVEEFEKLLSPHTRFASVMLGNNETGVLQPVTEIAELCRAAGVPLHTDAVQVVGKLPVDFRSLGVSAMSVAAHKFHGPVGVGVLVVRHGVAIEPILFGGFQQAGLRPGTESVALAVGMHRALEIWHSEADARARRMRELRNRLEAGLKSGVPGLVVNGAGAPRLPHTSNLAFRGLDRQALLMALDLAGIACSTGSACASGSAEPSPVLVAMGCEKEIVASSLRFSLGARTTAAEIDEAVQRIVEVAGKLAGRRMAFAGS